MVSDAGRWILVVALVATSGCSGLSGGGTAVGTETGTATPVTVPTEQPSLPPGVTAAGVERPGRLGAANGRVLNTTGHRLERTVDVRGPNGTLRVERVQRRGSDGAAVATLSVRGDGPVDAVVETRSRYRALEVVHSRAELADGRTITNRLPVRGSATYFFARTLPRRLLTAGTYEVTRTGDGAVLLRSRGSFDLDRGLTEVRTGRPRNVSVRAVITERGLVRELEVAYDARTGPESVRVHITQSVTLQEGLVVDRPAWVPEADSEQSRPLNATV